MHLALTLMHNKQDAEDLLQDAAFQMLRYKVYEKPYSEQVNYLKTTLFNIAYKNHKHKKRRGELLNLNYHFILKSEKEAESRIEFKEVMRQMKRINPVLSQSLLAQAYGYSIKEICEATGAKQNAVLSRVSYARKQLKLMR